MMGERTVAQEALFYSFNIERHVPADHILRSIDRFVDLSGVREHLRPFYSDTGRPSVDPELMIRMLMIGYCMGILSERRLCEEVHLNLAYRWFCRLGLEGDVPDHSTFSKNRHGRFRDSDLLREVFEMTVRQCIAEKLVGGEGFAVDASLIRADVSRPQAVLAADGLPPGPASRAVREYLAVLDDAAFGGATPVVPKYLAPSDPASRFTAATPERAFFAYSTNYLIDLEYAVIVDVEATTAIRQAEILAQRRMIERTQDRFDLWPARLAADTAYGSAENLAWLVDEKGIEPHIPVFDKSARRDGTFERDDFTFDHADDSYTSPPASSCDRPTATSPPSAPASIRTASSATAPHCMTADLASCVRAARPTCPPARSPARCMKAPVTWPATLPRPTPTSPRGDSERRSRCCSPTSNAS
nr:B288 [uncultured bacterium]